MNPFLLSSTERLADWRQFRVALTAMSEPDQLAAVAAYWARAPLSMVDTPLPWPAIWQMMQRNVWSRHSVAIGMEATLRLAGWQATRLTLCRISEETLMVLIVDDLWLLNYDWGSFRPYATTEHTILHRWRFNGKDYLTLDG